MDYFEKHNKILKEYSSIIKSNIENLKLFPEEEFKELMEGIYVTTNKDSQGEKLPKKFLEKYVEKVQKEPFYTLLGHDNSYPPIGRVIDCKLFYDSEDDEYFVYGITGIYDQDKLTRLSSLSNISSFFKVNNVTENFEIYLALDSYSIEKNDYDDLIRNFPKFSPRTIEDRFYKAAEPIATFTIVSTIFLLLANPFSKKILETYGERTVKIIDEFYYYLKKHFFIKLLNKNYNRVIAEIESEYKKCKIFLVVDNKNADNIDVAIESIPEATFSACNFIENISDLEPTKICFIFKTKSNKWQPEYIVTSKKGVIIDKPILFMLEKYKGLSVGGARREIKIK
ncbi:MAG: hypothetical protein IPM32_00220 [Ignavibacteriae bacterium]|nr:hypothetical protein [Ignavibacteriota bacterium]